jgi:hypothetical protein
VFTDDDLIKARVSFQYDPDGALVGASIAHGWAEPDGDPQ